MILDDTLPPRLHARWKQRAAADRAFLERVWLARMLEIRVQAIKEYVRVMGDKVVTDMVREVLPAFAAPLSDILRSGGLYALTKRLFAAWRASLNAAGDERATAADQEQRLRAAADEVMGSLFAFLHRAIVLDTGMIQDLVEWMLVDWLAVGDGFDIAAWVAANVPDEAAERVWREVDATIHYRRVLKVRQGYVAVHAILGLLPMFKGVLSGHLDIVRRHLGAEGDGRADAATPSPPPGGVADGRATRAARHMLQRMPTLVAAYPPAEDGVLTHIEVTHDGDCRDNLKRAGYNRIDVDIAGVGRQSYVWFRLVQRALLPPITAVAVSHDRDSEADLRARGFVCIDLDLNRSLGGSRVLLWYAREAGRRPLAGLAVTTGSASVAELGYTRLEGNLRRGSLRTPAYLWYRRAASA